MDPGGDSPLAQLELAHIRLGDIDRLRQAESGLIILQKKIGEGLLRDVSLILVHIQHPSCLVYRPQVQHDGHRIDQAGAADPPGGDPTYHRAGQAAIPPAHLRDGAGGGGHAAGDLGPLEGGAGGGRAAQQPPGVSQGHLPIGAHVDEQGGPLCPVQLGPEQISGDISPHIAGHRRGDVHRPVKGQLQLPGAVPLPKPGQRDEGGAAQAVRGQAGQQVAHGGVGGHRHGVDLCQGHASFLAERFDHPG